MKECSMPNCGKQVKGRGLCSAHYELNRRHGKLDQFPYGHGMKNGYKLPEYWVHCGMLQRCHNPKNTHYYNYGGRGITVCDRWRGVQGFTNFYADMGSRPTPKHTIERINNDDGYSPDNCKWATRLENNNNRRKRRSRDIVKLLKQGYKNGTISNIRRRTSSP